ncbi:MAG: hypothetical protein KGQ43_01095 [Acidobacteria bacterium]|nr:hypothetical protein [Acidobacteriota bacterium]
MIGATATGFVCRRCFCCRADPFFDESGVVIVTFGVMYVGVTDGFVGPTGVLVVDESVVVVSLVFVSSLFGATSLITVFVSSVVPASDVSDAFVAMTGATGMATNGTAVIAAKMHATVTLTVRASGRIRASFN